MVNLVFKWLHIVDITELGRHLHRSNASLQLLLLLFSDIFHLIRFVRFTKLETIYFRQELCKLLADFWQVSAGWRFLCSCYILWLTEWYCFVSIIALNRPSLLFLLKILRQFFLTLYFSGSMVTTLFMIEFEWTCLVLVIIIITTITIIIIIITIIIGINNNYYSNNNDIVLRAAT